MTARRDVEQRLRSLGEIREVMNSMKTLAFMETHKLARFLATQQHQVAEIEAMAADLLAHYPAVRPQAAPDRRGFILVGSERGFCGDFNERLIREPQRLGGAAAVIAVGQRLGLRLEPGESPATIVDGASASEQVAAVRDALARSVAAVQREHGPLALTVVYHHGGNGSLRERQLDPPFSGLPVPARRHGHPPQLQLPPPVLFAALLDQYLFAVLSEALYTSLMAENQKRMQHLDSAIRHLDERREDLARRRQSLRQEEIIEEIEVLLLNVEAPASLQGAHRL